MNQINATRSRLAMGTQQLDYPHASAVNMALWASTEAEHRRRRGNRPLASLVALIAESRRAYIAGRSIA